MVPHLRSLFGERLRTAFAWIYGTYVVVTTFYTAWTLIAFWLLSQGYLHASLATSIHLMLMTSSIGGFYITYVYPRKIVLRNIFPVEIVLEGWPLRIGDLLSHHLPLLLSMTQDNRGHTKAPYLLVLGLYLMGNDPRLQYHVDDQDVAAIFFIVAFFYIFM